ncbi:YqcI/YcgG family protein [Bacillus rhizoplanae]|uniref:YqcI/YcgG family protein n=1 Tax=Bacillus rhizoplanae TaxID=2880966 RepID=UPI003D19D4B3
MELIKSKVEGMPIYPDLGGYDAPDKREWKQYVITDDNESIKGKCPFHTQFNEKNSN